MNELAKDISKDRSLYQREYYESHKEELSKKRKEKYQNDSEYREKVKEASRRYREKKRVEREALKKEGKWPKPKKRGPRTIVMVNLNGKKVEAYTIPVLAKKIRRSISTVNKWITVGTIPKTPFLSKTGGRLYTDAMVLVIKMAIQSRGIVGDDPEVRKEIVEGWKRFGIPIKNGRVIKKK